MLQRTLTGQRFVAVFILGWLLFNYPLLALFSGTGTWFGIPVLYAYLFVVWALVIALLAYLAQGSLPSEHYTSGDAAPPVEKA